ncbi:ogr/Delta-like zinc finger family protein [Neisseria wadsworthii]|nr:ogr/Delta-like zinc finger family protein [Neisseria wadsworthii]
MMALKNRNQHDPDRFRIAHACPVCSSPCLVRGSGRQTLLSRMSLLRCSNPSCGWSGVAVTEIVRTLSPASKFYDKSNQPPEVDGKYEAAVRAELEAAAQEQLI